MALGLSISYRRFETKGVKITALLLSTILTVGFCIGFCFFSLKTIINEQKIIAVTVTTYAVAKRKPKKLIHWENWTFYRDSKMSVNCKFIEFL